MTGFEPATFGTTNQRSNQLSYIRHCRAIIKHILIDFKFFYLEMPFAALIPLISTFPHAPIFRYKIIDFFFFSVVHFTMSFSLIHDFD